MASYETLFQIGDTFEAFVCRGLDTEKEAVERFSRRLSMNLTCPTVERLEQVQARYHLLIAGELWCPDCQLNITALKTLNRLQPRIDMAIISKARAEHDLKDRLQLERIAIPLVLVLDENFELLGTFVEQPTSVIDRGESARDDYRNGRYLEETITEVLAIIEKEEGLRRKVGTTPPVLQELAS
jgi:hypothetical protein